MTPRDPFTVAVVMATGAVVVGGLWLAAGVAVMAARTTGYHRRQRNATRSAR